MLRLWICSVVCRSLMALAGYLAALAGPAVGEGIAVRSGDHPGFSRLVIDLNVIPTWSINASGPTRTLTFDGRDIALDGSGIYARIGRSRIASVRTGPNQLQFDLACNCDVSVYGIAGGRLVIDVRDRSQVIASDGAVADTEVKYEGIGFARPRVLNESLLQDSAVASGPSMVPPQEDGLDGVAGLEQHGDRAVRPRRSTLSALPRLDRLVRSAIEEVSGPDLTVRGIPWDFAQRSQISAATEALVGALQRAGDQGLVDRLEREVRDSPNLPVRPPPGAPLPLPIGDRSQLRVTTSLDRDLARLAGSIGDSAAASGCLSNYDFDVEDWGEPDDAFQALGVYRTALLGEFDAPDIGAARHLVRAYLYLSFGAEARAVLDAFDFDEGERAVYAFLAEVADGATRPSEDEAAALVGCNSPVALWALLSVEGLSPTVDVSKSEIAAAFSALPIHLRRQYGPVLVRRFLALEDPNSARVVWNAVDRVDGDHGEEFVLASAEMATANGNLAAAERSYARLEAGSPGNAPKAVVRLIRSRLARGRAIDPGLVETANALSFENRGTETSRDLKIVELRGRISLGQWDLVLEELPRAEFAGALARSDAEQILAELYVEMAASASTSDFLSRAFEAAGRFPERAEFDTPRRRVSERLVDLGFAEEALSVLLGLSQPKDEDVLTMANAMLGAGQPEDALERLGARDDRDANALRAKAHQALGQLELAAEAFAAADQPEDVAMLGVRSGKWESDGSEVGKAALRLSETVEPEAETPLARNRELATTAQMVRDDIAQLRQALAGLRSTEN